MASNDRGNESGKGSTPRSKRTSQDVLAEAEALFRTGQNAQLLQLLLEAQDSLSDAELRVRAEMLKGMGLYDLGDVDSAILALEGAHERSRQCESTLRFASAFALFVRKADFETPEEIVPSLARLRQLASQVGDARSLGSLHLAVARLEGFRGHCVNAHRHLEVARRLAARVDDVALQCIVDNVEASLETIAGNLGRARRLAEACLRRAEAVNFSRYVLGASTNLAVVRLSEGHLNQARETLEHVLRTPGVVTHIRFGALDALASVELLSNQVERSGNLLSECATVLSGDRLPARSWYDLAHQLTRCAYFDRLEDWRTIVDIVDDADPEVARRQYKAIRTSLLCAKARALARLGQHAHADTTLATAVRICPRGAVDPLIVLEATKALCRSLRGDHARGGVHFDRALAACRAIGHRYHEAWISRDRDAIGDTRPARVAVARRELDITDTALLLSDVATILGAGHSIDLLAHRVAAILESTTMGARVDVHSESGREYLPEPSASWDAEADGSVRIRLRGSDRLRRRSRSAASRPSTRSRSSRASPT